VARFYSLMIERDLFGRVVLVRNWGRIGTQRARAGGGVRLRDRGRPALEAVAQPSAARLPGSLKKRSNRGKLAKKAKQSLQGVGLKVSRL
jgi:predicted DNA-binding WGR domain protein